MTFLPLCICMGSAAADTERRWPPGLPARPWELQQPAGVLAAFLVSGLMHNSLIYYLTLRAPTGGSRRSSRCTARASICTERWCARRGLACLPGAAAAGSQPAS